MAKCMYRKKDKTNKQYIWCTLRQCRCKLGKGCPCSSYNAQPFLTVLKIIKERLFKR